MTTQRGHEETSMSQHPDILALREQFEREGDASATHAFEGLVLMGAIYAAISPWVVDFHAQAGNLTVNNLIVGIGLGVLALCLGANYAQARGLRWVVPLGGIWLIISPWVVAGTSTTTGIMASNVAVGAVICAVGFVMMGMTMPRFTARARH